MKKLLMLVLALAVAFGISFSSTASDKNKADELVGLIKSGEVKLWNDTPGSKVMYIYENTGAHDHFETTFKKHYAIVERHPAGFEMFTIVVRNYQDYYTIHDAQGFILYVLVDYNKDGIVDKWRKDYLILLDKSYFLVPNYPPGLINYDWFEMSKEEAQKIYDAELNYMLENVDKAKDIE